MKKEGDRIEKCLHLDKKYCILSFVIAAMAQEVERRLGKAEATGSNPVSSFFCGKVFWFMTGIPFFVGLAVFLYKSYE